MPRTPNSAYSNASVPTTKTEIISAKTATTRLIHKCTFTNNSGGTLFVDLYIDPTGASEVQLVDQKRLVDQETWSCPDIEGHVLTASGTVDVTASGTGIDLVISVIEVT